MFKKIILSATVAAAAMAANSAQAAGPNLVTNGGFETTTLAGNFEFDNNYAAGKDQLTGWASTGGYNILFHSNNATTAAGNAAGLYSYTGNEYMWAATASPNGGGNFVALDGDPQVSGAITQTISGLVVGQVYTLSFDWAAGQLHSRTGNTTEQILASLGTDAFTTSVVSNVSGGFSGWQSVSTTFTAKSSSELLSFLSVGTPTGLPPVALLDNVSLTAAVPEASTWSMMIIGFGAIGCAVRRSRTKLYFA